ncbi:MAG: hybrid sensor histidine kinase/response regulator [Bacteroidales bacterium]
MKRFRFEHRITLAYLVIGCIWILFSDRFLLFLFSENTSILSKAQTYKGWFYVITTAILFFFILRRYVVKLRLSQQKAEESDRLKTAFLQNISHEIRTPMNSICGFSTLLNKENIPVEKRKHYSEIIIKNSNQLLSIVTDILSVANIETNQEKIDLSQVRLSDVFKKIYIIYQPIAQGKGIDLKIDIPKADENLQIRTDEEKIHQILWNLVSNAVKFTNSGMVTFGYKANDGSIEFFVNDTGIGIEPENQEKVFQRFVQADSTIQLKYGGTGLGLTIAKAYVEMLGGKIQLISKPDQGTSISFSLPVGQYIRKKPTAPPILDENQTLSSKTILIAEDEEYNYIYLEELLLEREPTIIRARNGKEAVEICTKNSAIDLVIMDIKMPIMNGYEATKHIKKLRPSLPVIAHTAYASSQDENKAHSHGVDGYLAKPLDEKKLFDLLKTYIN